MSDCLLHTGSRKGRYGGVWTGEKQEYAHRLAFVAAYGEIPDGHLIHHTCGEKLCVNPEHLEAVSRTAHAAVHAPTHCHRGHEFTPENTYRWGGMRHCRTCRREYGFQWRAAHA